VATINYFSENRTSLMLHFSPYAKIFQRPKGGGMAQMAQW